MSKLSEQHDFAANIRAEHSVVVSASWLRGGAASVIIDEYEQDQGFAGDTKIKEKVITMLVHEADIASIPEAGSDVMVEGQNYKTTQDHEKDGAGGRVFYLASPGEAEQNL